MEMPKAAAARGLVSPAKNRLRRDRPYACPDLQLFDGDGQRENLGRRFLGFEVQLIEARSLPVAIAFQTVSLADLITAADRFEELASSLSNQFWRKRMILNGFRADVRQPKPIASAAAKK